MSGDGITRPRDSEADAEAIKTADSDAAMNQALSAFLEYVDGRHEAGPERGNTGKGTITFRYRSGEEAAIKYVAAPLKRANAGKKRPQRPRLFA